MLLPTADECCAQDVAHNYSDLNKRWLDLIDSLEETKSQVNRIRHNSFVCITCERLTNREIIPTAAITHSIVEIGRSVEALLQPALRRLHEIFIQRPAEHRRLDSSLEREPPFLEGNNFFLTYFGPRLCFGNEAVQVCVDIIPC